MKIQKTPENNHHEDHMISNGNRKIVILDSQTIKKQLIIINKQLY